MAIPSATSSETGSRRPLCFIEAVLALLKQNLLNAFLLLFWLLRGKARLEQGIADWVGPAPTLLPYSQPLLDYFRAEIVESAQ